MLKEKKKKQRTMIKSNNDVARIFAIVCGDETDAFWCFHHFLSRRVQVLSLSLSLIGRLNE